MANMIGDFHMKFVKSEDGGFDPKLTEASNMLKEHGMNAEWIDYEECLGVNSKQRNVSYVIHTFEGPAYENLKQLACRVYGPQCILASLNFKVEMPHKKRPIHNVCMKDVTISCTNLNKETRDKMHELVELMGGEASRPLTATVTHLIAGEVGSEKYSAAAGQGIPVVSAEWVKDVWEIAQHRYVDGKDKDIVKKYRCPVFKGLVITVSGLTQDERKTVKQLIESEGGTYTGEMKMKHCTHLIAKEPKGPKYDYAIKWKVHVVTIRWMYESLDKNYCLKEKNYPLEGTAGTSGVKTSTPEKSRLSVLRPNITDISAISAHCVEETVFPNSRLCLTTQESFEATDRTSEAESFLADCKVYLSESIPEPRREKCKQILIAGGAIRVPGIDETVTHVAMDQEVESEINSINNLKHRPYIVNSEWMMDCFQHNCHLDERSYTTQDQIDLPKITAPQRKNLSKNNNKRKKKKTEEDIEEEEMAMLSSVGTEMLKEKEGEMEQTLTQYIEKECPKERIEEPMDEVDGHQSTARPGCLEEAAIEEAAKDDVTQDPNNETEEGGAMVGPAEGGESGTLVRDGVFGAKTFRCFGFSVEDERELSEFVTEAGGVYLSGSRKTADYGVVPILGYHGEKNVREEVTNVWLQMCCDAEDILPVDDNPLFCPVFIDETARPLEGCVLSISGYVGIERDCLAHIADLLGATCQEFFVRAAVKSLPGNTHLVVKEASGTKYNAARKWKIPAVAKEWLFACAKSGVREDEKLFHIDVVSASNRNSQPVQPDPHEPSISQKENVKQNVNTSDSSSSTSRHPQNKEGEGLIETAEHRAKLDSVENVKNNRKTTHDIHGSKQQTDDDIENNDQMPTENVKEHTRKQKMLAHTQQTQDHTHGRNVMSELAVPSSSTESMKSANADSLERVPSSSDREHGKVKLCSELENPMASAKAILQQQQQLQKQRGSLLPQNQKEFMISELNRMAGNLGTPAMKKRALSRVEELQQQSRKPILSPGADSPSVFLAPGYRPNFDLQAVFDYLKSPDLPQRRESLSLEELIEFHLAEGVKNSAVPRNTENTGSSQTVQVEEDRPLKGVVISVSKKLGVNQLEYNTMAAELGGDYSWQYSPTCTHFIFQGRVNDLNKEFRKAKSEGKIIVAPQWLYACMEQRCRVDESMFPHTYNPNMNLGDMVRTETPRRGLRRSARTPRAGQEVSSTNTPSRPVLDMVTTTNRPSTSKARMGSVEEEVSSDTKPCTKDLSPSVKALAEASASSSGVGDKNSLGPSSRLEKDELCEVEEAITSGAEVASEQMAQETVQRSAADHGGSLEIREALSKTLETVKASSSRSKKCNKKRNRRTEGSSSGGQINTSGNLSDAATSHHASPWQTEHKAQDNVHTMESLGTEASQSVQITWDDPTGRREKERLAHKLEMTCGPSQSAENTEDFMAHMDMPDFSSDHTTENPSRPAAQPVRSPTPEAPPLAFPPAKCMSKISSPQPIDLLSDESSDCQNEHSPKPIILTSGMAPQERIEYGEVVERLGGTMLEKQQFDPDCTHLVVVKPSRNEKFLAAVATGRWVLHKSYLVACQQEGKFVREEDHEWGNPAMSHLMQSLDSQTFSLVQSAHRWRKNVHTMKKNGGTCPGAFQGWRVILLTERKREHNFRRLLTAGGATVLSDSPPFSQVEATHAFVELHKVKLSETDLEALFKGVTYILMPEFIAAHLTGDPPPAPQNYTPPDIENLRARLHGKSTKKRKAADHEDQDYSKRSRR